MAKTWRRKRKCSLVLVRILGAIWAKDQDLLGRNYPSQRKRRQVTSRPASVCCTMNLPPLRVVKKTYRRYASCLDHTCGCRVLSVLAS